MHHPTTNRRRPRIGVLATAASLSVALGGCFPAHGNAHGDDAVPTPTSTDARFAAFTETLTEEPKTLTDAAALNDYIPSTTIIGRPHYIAQRGAQGDDRIPAPDPPFWLNAVAEVEETTARPLDNAATGPADVLPAVHPDLHGYVPTDCTFTSVPAEAAATILDTDHANIGASSHFGIDELAVSRDCAMVVMVGSGWI